MAITNFTAAEIRGTGSLGPTLTGDVIITATNTANSNGQFPASYLTFESNATANQNLTTSGNLGEIFFFSPNTGNFSQDFPFTPYGKSGISIPFRTQPGGSAIQEGALIAVALPTTLDDAHKNTNLLVGVMSGVQVIDTSGGVGHAGDTVVADVASGLICVNAGGQDITNEIPSDTALSLQYDSNSILSSISINFTGDLPIAIGTRFELTAVADSTLVGTGFRVINPGAFERAPNGFTFTDPYYIKSTGNISIKMEDL